MTTKAGEIMSAETVHTVYEMERDGQVPCGWFARCDNLTRYGMDAPGQGASMAVTPICERCARTVGVDLATGRDI